MKRVTRLAILLTALLTLNAASAQSPADSREAERQLRQAQAELERIGQEMRRLEGERGTAQRALREADEAVARSSRMLGETRAAIVREEAETNRLKAEQAQLQAHLVEQQQVLAQLVRASYMNRNNAPLKVLLSQDQVARGQRDWVYYSALQRARSTQIEQINAQLDALRTVETTLGEKQRQLVALGQRQQRELSEVEKQRRARGEVLAQMDRQYQDGQQRAQAIGEDVQRMERLLARLRAAAARREAAERALAEQRARREAAARAEAERRRQEQASRATRSRDAQSNSGTRRTTAPTTASTNRRARPAEDAPRVARAAPAREPARVAAAVGGAGWPLTGNLLAGFGARMPDGSTSNGLLIAAAAGSPVRAVADGQVVFSEWMSGYGLLCIVDHGNGYMSLYAHNDALMKNVGSRVQRGDVLARVGNSGGQGQPALYFELRRQSRPVNPNSWLSR